jgi:ectoine hydroxylase-related dioxygenase (phytanoyl-CoA dioxygenase family)
MSESIFKNDEIQTQLSQNGWVLLDFCSNPHLERLNHKFYEMLSLFEEMPVIITLLHKERSTTKLVNNAILDELAPALDTHFTNYKVPIALFFAKRSNPSPKVGLHQDPMITDQVVHPSYGLWIPLIETDKNNGTLAVLDKSHRWFHPFQADTVSSATGAISEKLVDDCITLSLKRGQAVLMDNRLVHYSHPNESDSMRPSVVIKLTHQDANYYTLYKEKDNTYVIQNNEGFYLNESWIYDKSEFPKGKVVGLLDFDPSVISYEEYLTIKKTNTPSIYQSKSLLDFIKHQ